MTENVSTGPLAGLRVIELAGIGPVPHAGMLLADLGAEVVRIDRPTPGPPKIANDHDVTRRGKQSITLDLKDPRAREAVLQMVDTFDILLEGNRPGVTERLGLGPEDCFARNPRIIYGRMTGWGQSGPLASVAGHDINYISIAGALRGSGQADGAPQFALNLLGDYGGGSLYLVVGVLAALQEAQRTGHGQVVDTAIVDGAAHLLGNFMGMRNSGMQSDVPQQSLLDGGAPFYRVYETSDGEYMSVGAIEPQFFKLVLAMLDVDFDPARQHDRSTWASLGEVFKERFLSNTRGHWSALFDGTDACVAPILSVADALEHEHMGARGSILPTPSGGVQPGLAPRFSNHPHAAPGQVAARGADTERVLKAHTRITAQELAEG
ncbi:MAG TPA: CaiB/BaiF CoA-transferase family protein [Microbacteriaceae bacterium]|jgi:alpha-methylacyl-CoA racemase|nr:CaiB/BaiF CoA-transferase family protein [Microbacteriaceae bacterium]